MKDKIIIEKCTKNDGLKYINLKNLVWENTYQNIFPQEVFEKNNARKEKFAETFETFLKDKNCLYIFAKIKGEVVGLLFGALKTFNKHFQELGYGELVAIYIHPNFQGQGIGRKLKSFFESWLQENGITNYCLNVLKDNQKAIEVYTKWGGKLFEKTTQIELLGAPYTELVFTFSVGT